MTFFGSEERAATPALPDDAAGTSTAYAVPECEILLRQIAETIAGARPMPLSASVMINKEELLELLEEALVRLPDELRNARWLLKQREEFLAKARQEGDDIIDQARARAERMVQRTEVVKAAEMRARQVMERADERSSRLRMEAEDFVDQKLASFEIVLERTLKMVAAGRAKLQATPVVRPDESRHAENGAGEISSATDVVAPATPQPPPAKPYYDEQP